MFLSYPYCVLAQASDAEEGGNSALNSQAGTGSSGSALNSQAGTGSSGSALNSQAGTGSSGSALNSQAGTGSSDLNNIRTDDNIFTKFLNWLASLLSVHPDVIIYQR